MQLAKVDIEIRRQSGKGASRKTRASGKVPGVLYGHKEPPVSVTLDPLALVKSLDKEKKRNTVFTLSVAGDGTSPQAVTAMIRDVQIHPISRRIVHVDFIRVSLDEEIRVMVPLVLVGTPVGVVNGGNLHQGLHDLPVMAKPTAIPTKLELDVAALDIGDALHVSDLKLGPGTRILLDTKEALASVVAPRAEKEAEVAAAAVPAEGAAAAPAEGAPGEKAAGAPAKAAGGERSEKKAK